jgi:hypothetical protein
MKIRITFDTVETEVHDDELFEYFVDMGFVDDETEFSSVTEKDLTGWLDAADPDEFFSFFGFDYPSVTTLERVK